MVFTLTAVFLSITFPKVNAQASDRRQIEPPTHAEIVRTYINLATLPLNEQTTGFSKLTPQLKEKVYRFRSALEMAIRRELRSSSEDALEVFNSLRSDRNVGFGKTSIFPRPGNENVLRMLNKYIGVVGFDSESDRKTAFLELPVDEKKFVWKIRLALHLTVEDFDKPKQLLVTELLSIIDDKAVYSETSHQNMRATYDNFEERARALFGKADTFRLFMSLGNETSCGRSPLSDIVGKPLGGIETEGNCTCYYHAYCEIQMNGGSVAQAVRQPRAAASFLTQLVTGNVVRRTGYLLTLNPCYLIL